MWYRLLSRHAPIDDALAREITSAIGRMLSPAPAAGRLTPG
jgi:hypothetical protein